MRTPLWIAIEAWPCDRILRHGTLKMMARYFGLDYVDPYRSRESLKDLWRREYPSGVITALGPATLAWLLGVPMEALELHPHLTVIKTPLLRDYFLLPDSAQDKWSKVARRWGLIHHRTWQASAPERRRYLGGMKLCGHWRSLQHECRRFYMHPDRRDLTVLLDRYDTSSLKPLRWAIRLYRRLEREGIGGGQNGTAKTGA